MGLSRLSGKCRKCKHVGTCDHKRMEAYGLMAMPSKSINNITINMQSTITEPTITDIQAQIEKSLKCAFILGR